MKTKLLVSFGVALALSMTSIGCKQGEDTAAEEPSQDGGGGGGGGGTPTPTACNQPGSGNNPVINGAYIQNATIGRTINSITVYFSNSSINSATANYTVTAHQCGFGGTQVATATVNKTLPLKYNYYSTTITFDSPFTVADCAGQGTVAFKFVDAGSTTTLTYMGLQQYSGSACEMISATNASATPPVPHAGGYAYSGTVQ